MRHNKEEKICHCFHFIVILTKIAVQTASARAKTMLFLSISNYSKFLQNIGLYFRQVIDLKLPLFSRDAQYWIFADIRYVDTFQLTLSDSRC